MTNKILPLLLASIALLSSCSSVYKSAQTPDDVYYSPAREVKEVDRNNNREEIRYEESITNAEDRYLRMRIQNRRWSTIDDYDYWNDARYSYSCNCICNPPYSYYDPYNAKYRFYKDYGWVYYGSPYYNYPPYYHSPVYYKKPPAITAPVSKANIAAYKNRSYNNSNNNVPMNAKPGSNQSFGNMVKRVFSSDNSKNSNNSWDRPVRTFEQSNTSNSSSNVTSNSNSNNSSGNSGGYNSSGSSSNSGRTSRKGN